MKKKLLLGLFIVLFLCGCEKTIPKLDNGSEAVVSFNNGTLISVNELYEKMKKPYATQIIIEMIDRKILVEKYSDKEEETNEYAENSIKSVRAYYKDENELLSLLNQYYGYTSIEEYKEGLKLDYLRNLAVEDYAKSKVTDSNIKKYYKNEVVGDREVSHILIIPDVKDNMTDEEKAVVEKEAEDRAKEVIARLKKGEKFEDLAKEYSSDEATKENGGSLGFINKGAYGSSEFDNEAFSLNIGAYSNVPVKTNEGYEIILVNSEKDKKKLEEVKDDIIATIAKEEISKNSSIQIDALIELRKEYGTDIIDDEINVNYNKYMNKLKDQALQNNTTN